MSGHSDSSICPKCGEGMNTYTDYKPHDYVSGECLECGFYYWTETGQLSLDGVNTSRKELELLPIEKLRKRN